MIWIGVAYLIVGAVCGILAFLWGFDYSMDYRWTQLPLWCLFLVFAWLPLFIYRWVEGRPAREREKQELRDDMRDRLAWKFMHEVE